jgi:protein-tyrosine phosphatase
MTIFTADQAPAGIPNFGWADARRVARGQQPALTIAAYRELQALGIGSMLSLRDAIEYPEDERRAYEAVRERELCASLGLAFHHVPCTDFQAPHPSQVVRALRILHAEAEQGRAVYVHCFAGVGRTGVVCAAWQLLRGTRGDVALGEYARYMEETRTRRAPQRAADQYQYNIGARYQVWVLQQIAAALGQTTELPQTFATPQRPANGAGWRRRFQEQLQRHLGAAYGLGPAAPLGAGGRR